MIGVIVFFFQTFLFGFTSAQECKIPCQECKEIRPPMPQEYVGNWSLIDPSSKSCPPETPCLYQEQDMSSFMCFCDPGNILYEDTCAGNCKNCIEKNTTSVELTRLNDLTQYTISCPKGYALNGFNLLQDKIFPKFFYYNYTCCEFNERFNDTIDTKRTKFSPSADNVTDLTEQNVICPASTDVIKGYEIISNLGSNTIIYRVICGEGPTTLSCLPKQNTIEKGNIKVTALVDLKVQCDCKHPLLKQFQLKNRDNSAVWYEYTCCSE